ncbi:UNVERIFIED_CONTAM: hypothetical protein FKN15_072501 [Acipenser sinensis]
METAVLKKYGDEERRQRQPPSALHDHDCPSVTKVLLQGRDRFCVHVFLKILDTLSDCLHRSKAYVTVHNLLGFLTDFQNMSEYYIKNKAVTLVQSYPSDLDKYFPS